jgi:5-methylcytosine-specific restriction endonuclease McrA
MREAAMGRLTNLRPAVAALPARVKLAPKIAEDFYGSKAWRALAAKAKHEAGHRCQRQGCYSNKRLIADHIVERRDGGADLERSNIEVLCCDCHAKKTAQARARRAKGGG